MHGGTGEPPLRRSVSLPLLTLYGLGTTIGAGIYVLVGASAARAGLYAPLAFVVAALVISFSAASFAELSARIPASAGEAAFVRAAFGPGLLPLAIGLLVAASGIVSSAALVQGGAGYLGALLDLPRLAYVIALPLLLGSLAIWGISESLRAAALLTVVEIAGLLMVVAGGGGSALERLADPAFVLPPFDTDAIAGIVSAGLLAFFAFIGFEDIVNVAEETKRPRRTIPLAIGLTLIITTVFYVAVSAVAVLTVPLDALGASRAPLALVMERSAHATGPLVAAIASAAVLNGVLIQMIMATRVVYGLARMGNLPSLLAHVNASTRTPARATLAVTALILILALTVPLDRLAEVTSILILIVFSVVNLALWWLKKHQSAPPDQFTVPRWLPLLGFLVSIVFLFADVMRRVVS